MKLEGYIYLGNGPKATGQARGWRMDGKLFLRCAQCGGMLNNRPDESGQCDCGALHKDADWGRVGSRLGDDAIEVYRARPDCPCTRTRCRRYEDCDACRAYHATKRRPPMCEREPKKNK